MNREQQPTLADDYLQEVASAALAEDAAGQDITTDALIPPDLRGKGIMIAKGTGVVAGLPAAAAVFRAVDASLSFQPQALEGAHVVSGETVAQVDGQVTSILRAERVALNFLQHLSGIATATAQLVEAISGFPARILDTRKTTPGLRPLEKYAVRMGGGQNHRHSLADGILVKDNHWRAVRARGGDIAAAIQQLRGRVPEGLRVEIEVTSVEEAEEALVARVDTLLLDNMGLEEMRQVVKAARGRALTEASGGITLENVRAVAETGVDFVSVGAITHSAPALDMSLELEVEQR